MASSAFYRFISLLLLLLPLLPTVSTISNSDCQINLNSTLSIDDNQSWNSSSKEFAFGLRNVQLGEQGTVSLLAIWFTKDPNQTIVWFARDGAGSKVQLTNQGLAVYDLQGNQTWHRHNYENETSCATMLDNGNFVLLDSDGNPLWESFEEPTDTMFPGQKLNIPKKFRARKSDTDFSDGNFGLHWQDDGNLVLYYITKSAITREEKIEP